MNIVPSALEPTYCEPVTGIFGFAVCGRDGVAIEPGPPPRPGPAYFGDDGSFGNTPCGGGVGGRFTPGGSEFAHSPYES
jgi:hypothetical protein